MTSPPADQVLVEGDTVEIAGFTFEVLETPGHSKGHIVFVCKQFSPWIVFSGDVIFQNGVVVECNTAASNGPHLVSVVPGSEVTEELTFRIRPVVTVTDTLELNQEITIPFNGIPTSYDFFFEAKGS